ncbi:MAG: exonuclease domain-containing protein [bacterium]
MLPPITTFVAIDLETTGLDPAKDEIIEVGLVKFTKDEILETYTTTIKPTTPIPKFVSLLTSIQPEELEHAPIWSERHAKIQTFVEGLPIVGQSVQFDINFLKNNHIRLNTLSFDTFIFAGILEKKLPSYKLSYLADYYEVKLENYHRALADAQATAQIFQHMLKKMHSLKPELLSYLLKIEEKTQYTWQVGRVLPSGNSSGTYKPSLAIQINFPVEEKTTTPSSIKTTNQELFSLMYQTVKEHSELLLETQDQHEETYLPPLVQACAEQGNDIALIAGTKPHPGKIESIINNLTNNSPLTVQEIKPAESYLCLTRFEYFLNQPTLTQKEANFITKILIWLPTTTTGNRDEISILSDENLLWENSSSHEEFCHPALCSCHKRTEFSTEKQYLFLMQHRQLLSHYLPSFQSAIITDATMAHDHFQSASSLRVVGKEMLALIENLGGSVLKKKKEENQLELFSVDSEENNHTTGTIDQLLFMFRKESIGDTQLIKAITTIRDQLQPAYDCTRELWKLVSEFCSSLPIDADNRALINDYLENSRWKTLMTFWSTQHFKCTLIREKIAAILPTLTEIVDGSTLLDKVILATVRFQFSKLKKKLRHLTLFFTPNPEDNWVRWLSWRADRGQYTLQLSPYTLDETIIHNLTNTRKKIFLAPALQTKTTNKFITEQLNLDPETPFLKVESTRTCILDFPNVLPSSGNPEYQQQLAQEIIKLHKTGTKTLVIFGTQPHLANCYEHLAPLAEKAKIPVFAHKIPHHPPKLLELTQSENPGIFVAPFAFFWLLQNPLPALEHVIFIKVPFQNQKEPLIKTYMDTSPNGFEQYILPLTLLKIKKNFHYAKQLFPTTTTPHITLLDERIHKQEYGKIIITDLLTTFTK